MFLHTMEVIAVTVTVLYGTIGMGNQLYLAWCAKSVAGISVTSIALNMATGLMWCLVALLRQKFDIAVFVANFPLVITTSVLLVILLVRRKR